MRDNMSMEKLRILRACPPKEKMNAKITSHTLDNAACDNSRYFRIHFLSVWINPNRVLILIDNIGIMKVEIMNVQKRLVPANEQQRSEHCWQVGGALG